MPEQICQIMALACEDPERLDVPISQWSQNELARQAMSRGIVKSISHGSVGRFLKSCGAQAASQPLLADPSRRVLACPSLTPNSTPSVPTSVPSTRRRRPPL
jgi:hypothetical protein